MEQETKVVLMKVRALLLSVHLNGEHIPASTMDRLLSLANAYMKWEDSPSYVNLDEAPAGQVVGDE